MIITLAGELEAGKDTVADYLVKNYGLTSIAIAGNIKKVCMKVFELSKYQIYSTKGKEADLPNSIFFNNQHVSDIIHWLAVENKWDLDEEQTHMIRTLGRAEHVFRTSRQAQQFIGTEIFRDCIRPTFNIEVLMEHINSFSDRYFVVTDGRYADERNILKEKMGSKLVLVKDPAFRKGFKDEHRSENDLGKEEDYDYVFINDKTLGLEECAKRVHTMMDTLKRE